MTTKEIVWEYRGDENGGKGLKWCRDANRLPNGNTLIVDSSNHKIIEVTPEKEVVWEMDIPKGGSWLFQADRVSYNESRYVPPKLLTDASYNFSAREFTVNIITSTILAAIAAAAH